MATKYVRHDADGAGDGTTTANSGANGAWTFAQMLAATPAAGDEIRIMNTGTYTRSATGTISWANGTAAANIKVTGANSSGTVDGTRPTIQASAGSITLLTSGSDHLCFDRLIFDGNAQATVSGFVLTGTYARVRRSKAMNCTVRGFFLNGGSALVAEQLEATGCSGTAAIGLNGTAPAWFCYVHDNTIHGFQMSASSVAYYCIADTNTGASTDGFNSSSIGYRCISCVAYANGRDGFNLDGNSGFASHLANCLAYGNSGEGYGTDGVKSGAFLINCAGGSNTAGNYNGTNLPNVENFVSLSGDPFTNAAAGDFSLNNTAGAGAACRAAGFPGALPAGTTTGYLDIGVSQHADPVGGGGGGAPPIGTGSPVIRAA